MANVGFWLQGAKGKLAGSVLYKGEKGTLIREKVTPKNPNTGAQVAQRIIFATVAAASKFMRALINHSFEGVSKGNKSIRKFRKLNLDRLRQFAALDYDNIASVSQMNAFFTTRGYSILIPNKFILSQGSLNYSGVLYVDTLNDTANCQLRTPEDAAFGSADSPTVTVTENVASVSLADFFSWLIGLKSHNGQFTLATIMCHRSTNDNVIYNHLGDVNIAGSVIAPSKFYVGRLVPNADFDEARLNLGTVAEGALSPYSVTSLMVQLRQFFNLEKTDMQLLMWIASVITGTTLGAGTEADTYYAIMSDDSVGINDGEYYAKSAGIIYSEFVDGTWKYSNGVMSMIPPATGDDNFGLTFQYAQEAWMSGTIVTDNEDYLDQGEDIATLGDF